MTVVVPNALALASIADGSAIVASDHRNNYAAAQVGVNGLIAMFNAAATKGDLLVPSGGGTFDRLPVGSNGQTLVADSAQTLGVKWANSAIIYRKTTAKQVINTVTETDLLNGEITLAAGDLGTNRVLRLHARGDWVQNSGAGVAPPRIKLKLGATTLIDTGASGTAVGASATRAPWRIDAVIAELGATNAQSASMQGRLIIAGTPGAFAVFLATGEGVYAISSTASQALDVEGWNSGAVDATGALALALTVTLGTASASHDVTLKHALVVIE